MVERCRRASRHGELVGDISLLWASVAHRQGELGFVFHRAHQGNGYATEAAWQSELVYAMLAREWRGGSAGTERDDDRY